MPSSSPSHPPRTIAIVGATSSIAQHCARLWLARGGVQRLVLVGRDAARLESVAADLQVRAPATRVEAFAGDLVDPAAIATTVRDLCAAGTPDLVLIAHGNLPDQTACEADLAAVRQALEVNGVSPVLWAETFAGALRAGGHGRIGIIGSVAGDRGRQSNYVYGAAKGLVERYAQGLQHRLAGTGVRVTLVKPGPTDTPMTAHLKARGARLASAEEVAGAIVRGMDAGRYVVYAPAKWALIMRIIRSLPRWVFHRMKI
ncbi:SDR family NAD(P)-dependent oxidoreductase [Paracidovorax anthurii]|uniref:Short-subunit dehydrogenase n=1 Tax=Paracidovorax anthurii TaxID=78229 RepID=A0A328YIJ7_9BURK|nr:SDR family NAD(P)-dependent oxidoreductase [Paracidovorax anthurii]RAR73958.1 hypothetical protein AX018_107118 [Paracidovorax anthurii]